MAGAEGLGHDHRGMRLGHVVHLDVLHARIAQTGRQRVRSVLGIAVDGAVGDHHALVFGGVAAPALIFFDEPADILAPDGAVQRANRLDLQPRGLFEQLLHLRAVFAHDVGVIAARVVQPFGFKVHLVGEEIAAQRAKRAERVRREENVVDRIVGHHGLGPVDHGGHDEGQRVAAGIERVHLLHQHGAAVHVEIEELVDHLERLGVADDLHLGMAAHNLAHCGAVIRLHVIDDQIVERTAVKDVLEVLEELIGYAPVDGIQQHGLFIQQHIGVIGHAARDGEYVFKQRQTAVAAAHPVKIILNLLHAIHSSRPPVTLCLFRQSVPR